MRISLAQITPKLLDRAPTTTKIVLRISEAPDCGCEMIAFGESLLPAYPVWLHFDLLVLVVILSY